MDDSREILKQLSEIDKRLTSYINALDTKIDSTEKTLTANSNAIDKRLAYLETNAITRKEYNDLVARLDRIERGLRSI